MRKHKLKIYKLDVTFCPKPKRLRGNKAVPKAVHKAVHKADHKSQSNSPPRKQARVEVEDLLNSQSLDSLSCSQVDGSFLSSQVSIPSPYPTIDAPIPSPYPSIDTPIPSPYPVIDTPIPSPYPAIDATTPSPNPAIDNPSIDDSCITPSRRNDSSVKHSSPIADPAIDAWCTTPSPNNTSIDEAGDDCPRAIDKDHPSSDEDSSEPSSDENSDDDSDDDSPVTRDPSPEYPSPNTYLKKVPAQRVVDVLSEQHAGVVLAAPCVKRRIREMRSDYRERRSGDTAKVTNPNPNPNMYLQP